MSEEKIVQEGNHRFVAGSKKTIVGDNTFYSHEELMRVVQYAKDKLANNIKFTNIIVMREWLASEAYKLEMANKLIPNHNLDVKTVLVVNSKLDTPGENVVSFYEVTELVDVNKVRLRKLEKEVIEHSNYFSTIPSIGLYENDETIERKVVANSVKISDGELAVRLPFELYMVKEAFPIKVYKPTSYGIKA